MAKQKKWNPAKSKRKLDKLFSQLILTRDKRTCQWCGKNVDPVTGKQFKVDNSHCLPRELLIARWSKFNSVCLCFLCHKRRGLHSWHGSPLDAVKWLREYWGDEHCDKLLELSQQPYEFTEAEAVRIEKMLLEEIAKLSQGTNSTPNSVPSHCDPSE